MDIDEYIEIPKKLNLDIKTNIDLLKSKLTQFSTNQQNDVEEFTRKMNTNYSNESNGFIADLAPPKYNQFFLNQQVRSDKMRSKLNQNAKIKWPGIMICNKIREVQENVIL